MHQFKSQVRVVALALTLASVLPGFAWAGTKDGGGGKGVLCGNTVRVLDLFESEVLGNSSPGIEKGSLQKNLIHYGPHFSPFANPRTFQRFLKRFVLSKFRDVAWGNRLPILADTITPRLPPGCQYVQIAIYRNGMIDRDREYWEALPYRDQAALVFHEMLYVLQRGEGALTSDYTRWVIGMGMSATANSERVPYRRNGAKLWCAANGAGVYEWMVTNDRLNGRKGIRLYFKTFADQFQTAVRTYFVPGISLRDFQNIDLLFELDGLGQPPRLDGQIFTEVNGPRISVDINGSRGTCGILSQRVPN